MGRNWDDINIKITTYKLKLDGWFFDNGVDKRLYEKENTSQNGTLNLIFDKNVYLDELVYNEIKTHIEQFLHTPITNNSVKDINYKISHLIKQMYQEGKVHLEHQLKEIIGMKFFVGDPDFKWYELK